MKYKVKHLYPVYNNLPRTGDEIVSRIASYLYINYRQLPCHYDLMDTCIPMAENRYTFKLLGLYELLECEIMCKVRAKHYTRKVLDKRLFGK